MPISCTYTCIKLAAKHGVMIKQIKFVIGPRLIV